MSLPFLSLFLFSSLLLPHLIFSCASDYNCFTSSVTGCVYRTIATSSNIHFVESESTVQEIQFHRKYFFLRLSMLPLAFSFVVPNHSIKLIVLFSSSFTLASFAHPAKFSCEKPFCSQNNDINANYEATKQYFNEFANDCTQYILRNASRWKEKWKCHNIECGSWMNQNTRYWMMRYGLYSFRYAAGFNAIKGLTLMGRTFW